MTQYLDSIAGHNIPGGGLMSITRFSLECLYELHRKAKNWWTTSNCHLPLIRYTGCKIKLFRSTNTDYIFVYSTCGDMSATEKLYQSMQPAVLMLNKRKVIVKCNQYQQHRKPYKTIKLRPPTLLQNKWYFQQEIAKTPLALFLTSAASLDRYIIPQTAISNTIGFKSLNTDFFQYHNFKTPSLTTGYRPNDNFLMFTYNVHQDYENLEFKDLIYLANTKDYTTGISIAQTSKGTQWSQKVTNYFLTLSEWGNPFHATYFHADWPNLLLTASPLTTIKEKASENDGKNKVHSSNLFTHMSQPLYWECRYNSDADASHNAVFFSPITGNAVKWEQPDNDRLITSGLPLWLLLNGLIDYHTKAVDIQHLTTDYVLTIVSDYIEPKEKTYYVPLDENFFNGKSPYEPADGILTPNDQLYFHPKVNMQLRQITKIISTGPASPKLPDRTSTEAHMQYCFYFKLGGCPPPMDDVCDPIKQPKYPEPGNLLSSTLLQNPETPIEYYLNSFDIRRDILTQTAAKRLKTDTDSKTIISKPTGSTAAEVPVRTQETSSDETSEEEKDQQTLESQLQQQRRKQKRLRRRILELLRVTQPLE